MGGGQATPPWRKRANVAGMRTTVYLSRQTDEHHIYRNARATVDDTGTLTIVNDPDDVVLEEYPLGNWVEVRTAAAED